MNMTKSISSKKIKRSFDDLFNSFSEKELLEQSAQLLCYRFLSEIEQVMEKKSISKKILAAKVDTSPSYITQLFRGDRLANFTILAKIEKALDLQFGVTVKYQTEIKDAPKFNFPDVKDGLGVWVFKNLSPDYGKFTDEKANVEYNEEQAA